VAETGRFWEGGGFSCLTHHFRQFRDIRRNRLHLVACSDARGFRGHCRADAGFDTCDQLRVRFHGLLAWTGEISLHAAWPCGGVCDACVLRIFTDLNADHHERTQVASFVARLMFDQFREVLHMIDGQATRYQFCFDLGQ
jgi:hypothetical protein